MALLITVAAVMLAVSITPALAEPSTFNSICGDICVNTSGWWRDGGVFNTSGTPIQAAVNAAIAGETIYVYNGSYTENVDVNKRLTLRGEGADVVNVTAALSTDHVFDVTVYYVNISGFNVTGATGSGDNGKAGINIFRNQDYCNISDNNASGNYIGIYLPSNNVYNTLTNNTANSNSNHGISLGFNSDYNTLTNNTISNNINYGIFLEFSNSNTIYNNYFNNTNNAWDNRNNIWNTTPTTGTNIIGGSWLGGNYWSDYTGADTNGDDLGNTLIPYNSSDIIQNGGDYHPLVTPNFTAPNITSSAPESPVNDTYCTWRTFNVSMNQTVNVTWYLNGTLQTSENESVTEANYILHAEYIGEHNISAVAENANGTDMETWVWNVTVTSATFNCTCGDICVNEIGWWRNSGVLNGSGTPIQAAVDNATAGETIYVYNGSYTENMNVNKRLTLRGEGADVVNVTAASANGHVFEVTANYVNISGFNVSGAIGSLKAGIYLGSSQHCNIPNNNASGNFYGIYLSSSSNYNTLANNTANSNSFGIILQSSSNNTLTNNTANSNTYHGILLQPSSNYNTLANNIANSNIYGILLQSSSNNTLTNNTLANNKASPNSYGILLQSSSNNTLKSNTVNSNNYALLLQSSSNNILTSNTASNNSQPGIYLSSSSNNTIYNNYFNNTNNAWDNGNNIWNTTPTAGTNIIGGSWLGGNYWSDYAGSDTNSDSLGDTLTPYNCSGKIENGGDYHPLVTPDFVAPTYIPPDPTNLANTTGNYWVNYTWAAGTGFVTDGYNVSMNKEWHNGTETFLNSSIGAGNWSNITVWAWNKTGSGNMSATGVSDEVQAPAAGAPNITAPFAYITNFGSNGVSVIDTSSNTVTDTVTAGDGLCGVAVNPAGTRVHVANYNSNSVSVINTSSNTVTDTVTVGTTPYGVAVNPAGTRVYVANYNSNNVSVINTSSNTVIDTITVGTSPFGVAVNPAGTRVYVANYLSNNVSVIDTSSNTVTDTVTVGSGPRGVAVNPAGTRVYVANLNSNSVSVIDTSSNTVTDTITVGSSPRGVAVNPAGTRVYVANYLSNNVSVIDTSSNTVTDTVTVGSGPRGVAVKPVGTRVYVANYNSNSVSVIDTSSNTVTDTVTVGIGPSAFGIFISPGGSSDTTAPGITISTPQEGKSYSTSTIALNVTADESIVTWQYSINGTGNVTFTPNITLSNLPDGNHNVTVYANNSVGNIGSAIVNFSIDTIPPIAPTIDVPTNSAILASTDTWVNGTMSTDTKNVTVYVNGTIKNASVAVSGTAYNISNVPLGTDGDYEINVSAKDAAGNVNTTNATVTVTVDTLPATLPCTCGDICVNTSGWWRNGGVLNSSGMSIQAAIDNATAGEIIYVYNGSYTENVNVDKRLTLRGEGADVVNVTNSTANNHVFEVTADYVNISGFNVTGAVGTNKAGFYLSSGVDHCNLSDNTANSNTHGICLWSSNNNTLTDNTANSNNQYGIYLTASSKYNNFANNIANSNIQCGIWLYSSSNNIFTGNTANLNTNYGICLTSSSNYNNFTNNTASDNRYHGLFLYSSSNYNTLANNTFTENGLFVSNSYRSTVANNTVNGKPLVYYENASNITIQDAGQVILVNCSNITVENLNISHVGVGIELWETHDCIVLNNSVSDNYYGIYLSSSSNYNTLTNNTANNNNYYGIYLSSSSNNTLTNNTVNSNTKHGILLFGSSDNTLTNNIASDNTQYGIYLSSSSNNTIYNNYFNNTHNTWDNGNNIWNTTRTAGINIIGGSWLGGNYWSDYEGADTTGDDLGDTLIPYNSSSNIKYGGDYHPPVTPGFAAPNITSWDNSKTNNDSTTITINESESVRFNATANQTIAIWNWHNNKTLVRSNNFDNYTTSWSVNGTHTALLNVTNTNGTSSPVTWTISVTDITAPAQVKDLTNNTTTATTVDLLWTANTEADLVGYRVYRNGMLLGNTANTYYNAIGLSPSTTYEFKVSAYDDNGLTGANASIVVTTAVGPLHHIDVTPDSKTLNISESWNFAATGCDQNNGTIQDIVFAWVCSDEHVGNFTLVNDTTTNFTAEHVGVTHITASNSSVTSGRVHVTVNALPETGNVINGTGNATSGNSTATVRLNNRSVNGTIIIEEIGDPINKTEDIGNRTGLGTDTGSTKGVKVTVNGSIEVALNDMGGYVYIRIEYNELQLGNIDENTLHIYKFVNGTGWVKLVKGSPSYCIANGRNTDADCVWVNVTECSIFMFAGSPEAAPTPSGGDGSGGSGPYITSTPTVLATEVQTAVPVSEDMAAPAGTETEDEEAFGLEVDTGTDESTSAQTETKGVIVFGLLVMIVGVIIIVLVIWQKES